MDSDRTERRGRLAPGIDRGRPIPRAEQVGVPFGPRGMGLVTLHRPTAA